MTVMTPAYHAEQYSPDDNRHDLRKYFIQTFIHKANMYQANSYFQSMSFQID